MSVFEEYLMRGHWLAESERLAIYKYLLQTNADRYRHEAEILLTNKSLITYMANGEISYLKNADMIELSVRKLGDNVWTTRIRNVKLSRFKYISVERLSKFFAQAESDVIRNYPIEGKSPLEEREFAHNVYPYYTLDYYSNGKGKVKGLINKIRTTDDPLLQRLLAS